MKRTAAHLGTLLLAIAFATTGLLAVPASSTEDVPPVCLAAVEEWQDRYMWMSERATDRETMLIGTTEKLDQAQQALEAAERKLVRKQQTIDRLRAELDRMRRR